MRGAKVSSGIIALIVLVLCPAQADVDGKVFTSEGLPVPGAEVWLTVRPSTYEYSVMGKVIKCISRPEDIVHIDAVELFLNCGHRAEPVSLSVLPLA